MAEPDDDDPALADENETPIPPPKRRGRRSRDDGKGDGGDNSGGKDDGDEAASDNGASCAAPPRRRMRLPWRVKSFWPVVPCAAVIAALLFFWYGCRIEVGTGEIGVLIRKTGQRLPPDQLLAPDDRHQGIQPDVLREGRYFRNPYGWDWIVARVVDIPAGRLGVMTRQFGDAPPAGRIAAESGQRGIVAEPLLPGKHPINPYAYSVELFDAITIRPGCVGVLTRLDGEDVLTGDVPAELKNVLVVKDGVKGVQAAGLLDPGTYYLNPYILGVTVVNLQSQRFELSGDDAISFLTQDGFTVLVEGTLEFAVVRERAPVLTQQVGDLDDILKKIILPRARGFSRIEGSKQPAIHFIAGETRQNFQDALEKHLHTQCERWGIDIRSVLIRNITPPDDVAGIIREREVAIQNQKKIEQQIAQARSKAELTRQEMLAEQNREKVEAQTAAIRARIQAEQEQAVYLTASRRNLEVAKIDADAAKLQAEALLIAADADREVVAAQNRSEAAVAAARVKAFGGGMALARFSLYGKLAPAIDAILSTDRAPGLGGLFGPFLPEDAGVTREGDQR